MDVAAHLAQVCASQIFMITHHPWIRDAAHDKLHDTQIGSWATQDLFWGGKIGPAYELGFTDAPPGAQLALDFLKGNSARETAYLEATSQNFRNAPGSDRIWPGFLGYGEWGALTAKDEAATLPGGAAHVLALTIVWVAEYAYNQAWHVVLAGQPEQEWAKFGANNWGGPAFDAMVVNLSDGLDEAVAASSVALSDIEEIARQGFLWESRAWTDSFEGIGWEIPQH